MFILNCYLRELLARICTKSQICSLSVLKVHKLGFSDIPSGEDAHNILALQLWDLVVNDGSKSSRA